MRCQQGPPRISSASGPSPTTWSNAGASLRTSSPRPPGSPTIRHRSSTPSSTTLPRTKPSPRSTAPSPPSSTKPTRTVKPFLAANRPFLDAVVEALLEKESVDADDLHNLYTKLANPIPLPLPHRKPVLSDPVAESLPTPPPTKHWTTFASSIPNPPSPTTTPLIAIPPTLRRRRSSTKFVAAPSARPPPLLTVLGAQLVDSPCFLPSLPVLFMLGHVYWPPFTLA